MAPIEDRRRFKDMVDKSVQRGHEGNEPSDPPARPTLTSAEQKLTGGLRGALAHIGDWVSGVSKRVAFLWAVAGFLFTVVGALMAWWSTHQGFIKSASLDPINEQLAEIQKSLASNQRNNETSFATIKTDIEWLKREHHIAETQPIQKPPEKPHR